MSKAIRVCSILRYKGLDNKVIILAGMEDIGGPGDWLNIVYGIGMSRAKSLLYIFANAKVKDAIETLRGRKRE